MWLDTVLGAIGAIGALPVIGGGFSWILSKFDKPEIQCDNASYKSEDNGDITINATFTATTKYGSTIPITRTILNIRYIYEILPRQPIRGILFGNPTNFHPVNIVNRHAEQFNVSYTIRSEDIERIIRKSPLMRDKDHINSLTLEGVLERCTPLINIRDYMEEVARTNVRQQTHFNYWEMPLLVQFEFYYPRNRNVILNKRVGREDGENVPIYVDWYYELRKFRN